jgi:multicomponent Na+:H+ antiporter subunit G
VTVAEIIAAIVLSCGTLFMLVASFGIVRMPDVYLRLSVAAKASTLGLVLLVIAVPLAVNDLGTMSRVIAVVLFVFLTSPVAAHMIARAAYVGGVPLWSETVHDDLRGKYKRSTVRDEQILDSVEQDRAPELTTGENADDAHA